MNLQDHLNLTIIAHFMRQLPGVSEESVQVVAHYLGVCVEMTEAGGAELPAGIFTPNG